MATSVPGRMGSHTSARAASGVKRGSTTTVFTPAARSSTTARPAEDGACCAGPVPHMTYVSMDTFGLYSSAQPESAMDVSLVPLMSGMV